ncbi:MAG: hypothetical protein A4E45_01926 [Methanosaeta sp. PtaB.Bin039]|nr:MAG: hypothetical protein A4E45_01926 [Methanosaeta sp. PtaB.Bin039]
MPTFWLALMLTWFFAFMRLIMYGEESVALEAAAFQGMRDREAEPSMMANEVDFV